MRRGGYFAPPDAVEVVPGLRVGAAPSGRAAKTLSRAGVTYAIDLRLDGKGPSPWPESVQILSYPLPEYGAPSVITLDRISREVAALIQAGEIAFVHCRAGVQRAPMVACAILMQMGWQLADSYRVVSSRRSTAELTEAQLETLKALEMSLKQKRTGP
jgi:hypothetical protein